MLYLMFYALKVGAGTLKWNLVKCSSCALTEDAASSVFFSFSDVGALQDWGCAKGLLQRDQKEQGAASDFQGPY